MNKYISIHKFAQKNNVSPQNVYRWIREGKINEIKKEKITVERLRILDSVKIKSASPADSLSDG